jgi:hypothetical protein
MNIRDRIKELRRVRAGDLRPHPKNWRTHPEEQQNALRGILAEVGYVDALMVRELPDGSLQIVEGHLRAETTPDALVPVLVVDLDDKEADKVPAAFDPLAQPTKLRRRAASSTSACRSNHADASSRLIKLTAVGPTNAVYCRRELAAVSHGKRHRCSWQDLRFARGRCNRREFALGGTAGGVSDRRQKQLQAVAWLPPAAIITDTVPTFAGQANRQFLVFEWSQSTASKIWTGTWNLA